MRVLNATNGSIITATNASGTVIQTLTNLDNGQAYKAAAWDNVGNLYGASTTRNLWRVWSPPGTSTNTTMAAAQVIISQSMPIEITGISAVPTGSGCANVTITFTASGNLPPTSFEVVSSPTVNGTYAPIAGVMIASPQKSAEPATPRRGNGPNPRISSGLRMMSSTTASAMK